MRNTVFIICAMALLASCNPKILDSVQESTTTDSKALHNSNNIKKNENNTSIAIEEQTLIPAKDVSHFKASSERISDTTNIKKSSISQKQ